MMNSRNPIEEWQRLTDLYRSKGDEELLELRADFDDLTETAQSVLRDELRVRGLWLDPNAVLPTPAPPTSHLAPGIGRSVLSQDDLLLEESELLRIGGVPVGEYETSDEAGLMRYVLELAGIDSALNSNDGKLNLSWPQVRVHPDDLESARAVLARPVQESVKQDYKLQQESGDFITPPCKRCSNPDPLLESVEPMNQWRCEQCGATWSDPLPSDELQSF